MSISASSLEDRLREKIESKTAVLILGAGISKQVSDGHPSADWQGLLSEGLEYVRSHVSEITDTWVNTVRARIEQNEDTSLWLSAAHDIQETLKKAGYFENWLEDSIGQMCPVHTELIDALASLEIPIFTTNYDNMLAGHLRRSVITWQDPQGIISVLRNSENARERNIVHLHGYYKKPDSVIFGVDSYAQLLQSYAPEIEKSLAISHDIIFVGVGEGITDPNFSALSSWLRPLHGVGLRHFQVVRSGDKGDDHPLYQRVEYGPDYNKLAPFLQSLKPHDIPPPERTGEFRTLTAQLDFVPHVRTTDDVWQASEPIISTSSNSAQYRFSRMPEHLQDRVANLRKKFREEYQRESGRKIEQLIRFSIDSKIDLLVLPRAILPIESLETILQVSKQLCVVAGIGQISALDADRIGDLIGGQVRNAIDTRKEYALVSGPQGISLLVKRNREFQPTHDGQRGSWLHARTSQGWNYRLRVGADTGKSWAIEVNVEGDANQGPLSVQLRAAHVKAGGSPVKCADLEADSSHSAGPPEPSTGTEALIGLASSWNEQRPGIVYDHMQSSIVYPYTKSRLQQLIASGQEAVRSGDQPDYSAVLKELSEDTGSRGLEVARKTLRWASQNDDLPSRQEALLWAQCILPGDLLTRAERVYQQLHATVDELQQDLKHGSPAAKYVKKYQKAAAGLSAELRPERLQIEDQQLVGRSEVQRFLDADLYGDLIFAGTLGNYDSERAISALDKSLRLLQLVASEPDVLLQYRIVTNEIENAEDLSATFFVICIARPGLDKKRVDELRSTVGKQLSVTFHGAYSIAYTDGVQDRPWSELLQDMEWATPTGVLGFTEEPHKAPEVCDSALLVDFLRSYQTPVALTISCHASPRSNTSQSVPNPPNPSAPDELPGKLAALELAHAADTSLLDVSVTVHSKDGILGSSFGRVIGLNVCGIPSMTISDKIEVPVNPWKSRPAFTLPPAIALRVIHPPLGTLYRTSTDGRRMLHLPADLTEFPAGITFGTARVRRSAGDRVVEARLGEEDRFRHVYVIGKPGMGKTTLLKNLIRQDIDRNYGVTVVDPHGELVEAVAADIPPRRLDEVVLVDLGSARALPVINPLDVPKDDRLACDRAVQEVLRFAQSRVFHQFSGPRFEEMTRLVLRTMLDEGYPVSPAVTEITTILASEELRQAMESIVRDPILQKGWRSMQAQANTRDFPETLAWVTAKFDEVVNDSVLRAVVGGEQTTINVENIVNTGGILLVRLPEFSVGERAADFIGSIILARLRQATFTRLADAAARPPHFVYMDEFHRFAIEGFDRMVAEARKFRVGFTLAHQNVDQLRQFDPHSGATTHSLPSSIPGNAGTVIAFQIAASDAQYAAQLIGCRPELFDELGPYQAITSFSVQGQSTQPFLLHPEHVLTGPTDSAMEDIHRRMLDLGRWRDVKEVAEELRHRLQKIERIPG